MSGGRETAGDVERDAVSDDPNARIRQLLVENERLREGRDTASARRYPRGAVGFALLGLVAAGAGYALPESRTILFSFAGIGLFGAVLTYYFIALSAGTDATTETVYATYAEALTDIAGELGLRDVSLYVPTDDADDVDDRAGVRLFVPQQASYEIPENPDSVFVARTGDSQRGLAIRPVGAALFADFERSLVDPLAETPSGLGEQLAAALVEQFDLVADATPEYEAANDRLTVLVRGSTLGGLDRFDHPVVSFVGAGLARGLDRPVRAEVHRRDGGAFFLVYSWDLRPESDDESDRTGGVGSQETGGVESTLDGTDSADD